MKQVLEQWSGKFIIDSGMPEFLVNAGVKDEVAVNLDGLKVKDGDEFHVRLLPKNREVDDEEDLLSAYRL